MEKMFEKATRGKVRFDTVKGSISAEDLWDVPLQSRDLFNLDTIAKKVSKELKESAEESFVSPQTTKNTLLELKLEILKYVIKVKMEEADARKTAVETKERKEYLGRLIQEKQDEVLKGKSLEELQKEYATL